MATDGFGNYLVRVTDSVTSATLLMTPLDAKEAMAHPAARYTIVDPLVQPIVPPSTNPLMPQPNATSGGKDVVTGSKGANAALTSLIAALVSDGLITDSTS